MQEELKTTQGRQRYLLVAVGSVPRSGCSLISTVLISPGVCKCGVVELRVCLRSTSVYALGRAVQWHDAGTCMHCVALYRSNTYICTTVQHLPRVVHSTAVPLAVQLCVSAAYCNAC